MEYKAIIIHFINTITSINATPIEYQNLYVDYNKDNILHRNDNSGNTNDDKSDNEEEHNAKNNEYNGGNNQQATNLFSIIMTYKLLKLQYFYSNKSD